MHVSACVHNKPLKRQDRIRFTTQPIHWFGSRVQMEEQSVEFGSSRIREVKGLKRRLVDRLRPNGGDEALSDYRR